jgi:hypothetical protein
LIYFGKELENIQGKMIDEKEENKWSKAMMKLNM